MVKNQDTGVVSDEEFETRSAALAAGEPIEVAVPPAEAKASASKKTPKPPKVRKSLTVHKHWLIDIRRFSKELGIVEGQKLNGAVRTRKGKRILELEFV